MSEDERPSVVIWSSDWEGRNGQAIVTQRVFERQRGIDWISASYGSAGVSSAFRIISATLRIYAALLSGRADKVYLVCSRSLLGFVRDIPALLPAVFGVRVIVHVHGSDIETLLFNSPLAPIVKHLYSLCDVIIPSEHLRESLSEVSRRKIYVCENFVAEKIPTYNGQSPSIPDAIRVVWNSNIMSSKGFFEVAEAVRLARRDLPRLQMIALGMPIGDFERSAAETEASLYRLCSETWFTHLGSVSPEVAFYQTAQAEMIIFPSRYKSECQPLAIIQAMCLGKLIISSDTPAMRSTLSGYPAIFLPNPNAHAIAKTIVTLTHIEQDNGSPQRERRAEAMARARARFSPLRFDIEIERIFASDG
jgi:glycosyltransferase involved in cell wall biosynthesis